MKLAVYSDLHLEFDHGWALPPDLDADCLILAGDIIVFKDFSPFQKLLKNWTKPVLFVAGNHEYYTRMPMQENYAQFKIWALDNLPHVHCLRNEGITIDGVHFFGGTMWTDFQHGDPTAMHIAETRMNDFLLIQDGSDVFTPETCAYHHKNFKIQLEAWFLEQKAGPHVVITHHAPISNPDSGYNISPLQPAFVAYDMGEILNKYNPDVWIHGHTHECDNREIGSTRIVSNQLGYPKKSGGYECFGFDDYGCGVLVNHEMS